MNAAPIPKQRQNFNKMDRANKKKKQKIICDALVLVNLVWLYCYM